MFNTIFIILVLALLGVYGYVLYDLHKKVRAINSVMSKVSSEHNLETELNDIFADGIDTNKIQTFANKLFSYAKKTYGLKASSYSQIIDELKTNQNMNPAIKDHLLEFFEEVIAILYKNTENITDADKESLKKKVKVIISSIESSSK